MILRNKIFIVAACILSALFFQSCKRENLFDCFKSTGDVVIERRSIASFSEVEVQDNINVIFIQDSSTSLEVSAGENLLPLVVTELRDEKLVIENHNTCNWVRDFSIPIDVYVRIPLLKKVMTYGSGKISSIGILQCDILEVDNRGTGDVEMEVDAVEVYSKLSIGDNSFKGNADYLFVFNTSIGYSFNSELNVNNATIINLGIGHSYVNACDKLDVEIRSSGNILYRGSPIIQSSISGSGQLIQQ